MQPSITIVTPSFNQAAYLEKTIQSVLAQRADIHEYFVLDGGSTDDSVEIINKYASQIDYWASRPDGGQADAIRQGFERATGDVLAWLNSDDLLLPGAIQAIRERFSSYPKTQVVTGHYCQTDADGRLLRCMWVPRVRQSWLRWGVTRICQPSTFFRRDFYERIGGLDTHWQCVLDTELWCRMLSHNCNWHVLPQYVAARRYHSQTKGSTLTDQYRRERTELAQRYPQYRPHAMKCMVGRWVFRGYQCCNRQFWRSTIDTLLHRHKQLPLSPTQV
ncbi:MAG: glycosyltransferase family 2 protein [Planctomycetota bacterium]|nr:glycosyltransferase family 2 protein [Planctomycetota bacterium]